MVMIPGLPKTGLFVLDRVRPPMPPKRFSVWREHQSRSDEESRQVLDTDNEPLTEILTWTCTA